MSNCLSTAMLACGSREVRALDASLWESRAGQQCQLPRSAHPQARVVGLAEGQAVSQGKMTAQMPSGGFRAVRWHWGPTDRWGKGHDSVEQAEGQQVRDPQGWGQRVVAQGGQELCASKLRTRSRCALVRAGSRRVGRGHRAGRGPIPGETAQHFH